MRVFDHVSGQWSVSRANMFEHCDFVETTARAQNDDHRRVIAAGLDRAQSLPEFGANDNSAVGGYSGTN